MKFEIYKTSDRDGSKCPCTGANSFTYVIGQSVYKSWYIEINSIEDLMKLMEETNHPVILTNKPEEYWSGLPIIEIYDDWRE